jgi:hypothetical protein
MEEEYSGAVRYLIPETSCSYVWTWNNDLTAGKWVLWNGYFPTPEGFYWNPQNGGRLQIDILDHAVTKTFWWSSEGTVDNAVLGRWAWTNPNQVYDWNNNATYITYYWHADFKPDVYPPTPVDTALGTVVNGVGLTWSVMVNGVECLWNAQTPAVVVPNDGNPYTQSGTGYWTNTITFPAEQGRPTPPPENYRWTSNGWLITLVKGGVSRDYYYGIYDSSIPDQVLWSWYYNLPQSEWIYKLEFLTGNGQYYEPNDPQYIPNHFPIEYVMDATINNRVDYRFPNDNVKIDSAFISSLNVNVSTIFLDPNNNKGADTLRYRGQFVGNMTIYYGSGQNARLIYSTNYPRPTTGSLTTVIYQ